MLKPDLAPVYDYLCQSNLCFDALVKPQHLQPLCILLKRYPDLRVVIDHGAKPDISGRQFDSWARDMKKLATKTNALCKVSGLLTEAAPGDGYPELEKYLAHLLEHFGCERLMWGSDWPVLNLASDYSNWKQMLDEFCQGLDQKQIKQLMGQTAAQFYQLN